MLTDLQKKAAQAIVNIFETGSVRGEYGKVTLLKDDPGHLTYGRSQTTLGSGNLYLLIKAYCDQPQAQFKVQLGNYLARLNSVDLSLDTDIQLRKLLESAGSDPVMRHTQDEFFDRVYWMPAVRSAEGVGSTTALGTGVVYDSTVHGSWSRIRDRVNASSGHLRDIGEQDWITQYVRARREWLETHSIPVLQKTVYRMDTFQELIGSGRWDLQLPLVVRGKTLDQNVLHDAEPIRALAGEAAQRNLLLQSPPMTGDDVKRLQRALTKAGFPTIEDGNFGKGTDEQVKNFQKKKGMTPDGIVGPATRVALRM